MKKSVILTFFSAAVITMTGLFNACKKEGSTAGLQVLQQEIPPGFPAPVYRFTGNPLTKEGFELGKKLFYDDRLSADNQHGCASCHQQIAAFGTFEHDRSHGVYDSHTLRNAPALVNLAWNKSFDWDGQFSSLVNEAAHKIHEKTAMGDNFDNIISKLNKDPGYPQAFKKVFGNSFIQPENILKALAQFTASLVSADSKYDRMKKGLVTFTAAEDHGYQLYRAKCATCHPEPLFTDQAFRNTGLPVDNFLKDFGRMMFTKNREDSLKFKVPTLRNVSVSSNYMHDGRFNTLYQVLEHYRSGIQQGPTLDPLLANRISLTNAEVNDLVIFMKTLTDTGFLNNPKFRQ